MFKQSIHSESAIKKMYKESFRKDAIQEVTNIVILESLNQDSFKELSNRLHLSEIDFVLHQFSIVIAFEKHEVKSEVESILKDFELSNRNKLYYLSSLFVKELQWQSWKI